MHLEQCCYFENLAKYSSNLLNFVGEIFGEGLLKGNIKASWSSLSHTQRLYILANFFVSCYKSINFGLKMYKGGRLCHGYMKMKIKTRSAFKTMPTLWRPLRWFMLAHIHYAVFCTCFVFQGFSQASWCHLFLEQGFDCKLGQMPLLYFMGSWLMPCHPI